MSFDITYDYEELLQELVSDVEEGLVGDRVLIYREAHPDIKEAIYKPIADYYYSPTEVPKGERCEVAKTADVIEEMQTMATMFIDKSKYLKNTEF